MWVLSLGWEDPLEDGTATHSSILACRNPWMEEPGCKESEMTEVTDHAHPFSNFPVPQAFSASVQA